MITRLTTDIKGDDLDNNDRPNGQADGIYKNILQNPDSKRSLKPSYAEEIGH